jgi:hypothetical protein
MYSFYLGPNLVVGRARGEVWQANGNGGQANMLNPNKVFIVLIVKVDFAAFSLILLLMLCSEDSCSVKIYLMMKLN